MDGLSDSSYISPNRGNRRKGEVGPGQMSSRSNLPIDIACNTDFVVWSSQVILN